MSESNAAVVRRWFEEVWNQRRGEVIEELVGPDSVCLADDQELRGADGFRTQQYIPFLTAFPNLRVKVEDTVADRDVVVVWWSAEGTHTGDGLGAVPSGRTVRFEGLTWVCVRDGKLTEGRQWSNIPTVLASLRS